EFWGRGFFKDRIYVPPLSVNLTEIRNRITASAALVTPVMLQRVWQEIDFKMDVWCMTNGSHIEPLTEEVKT
ncbi:hypothetical protein C0J52_02617, partial [Blattella germanica]